MKKILFLFVLSLSLVSCKKSTDRKIEEFVSGYNYATENVSQSNPVISLTSAEKTGPNEVTITLRLKVEENEMEAQMMKSSFPQLIGQLLKNSDKNNILEDDVNFKVNIFDKNGKKLVSQTVDKNALGSAIDLNNLNNGSASKNEINQLLAVFNKNLPITDPSTGIKIIKIEVGNDNDVIYLAEVPDKIKSIFATEGSETLMKEEMLRDPKLQQVISQVSKFGIDKLKYQYNDTSGKLLKEIVISQKDIH